MSLTRVGSGIFESTPIRWRGATIGWRGRVVVPLCLFLICGSFACAGALEMGFGRTRALSEAREFGDLRSGEIAAGFSQTLDRYAAIAEAFSASRTSPETSAALAAAAGTPLRDVAVFDMSGRVRSEMTGERKHILPLPPFAVAQARQGRTAISSADGRAVFLLFPRAGAILSVQIDAASLLPPAVAADGILAATSGRLLALGSSWRKTPPAAALALAGADSASRMVEDAEGPRLVSLARVRDWPLVAGTSVPVATALSLWSGSVPLYLFMIIGPAFAGGALAILFATPSERSTRRAARAKSPRVPATTEARLLVRLAHAERRASESEDAKSRFVSHVSHELRTPLNAIIGFAEAIEGGVFGAPGHPKYSEYARDIGAAGRELHAKIGAVLEYAALGKKVEPNAAQPSQECDAAAVTRSLVEDKRSAAQARGIGLEAKLPDRAPARVDADSLGRILAHLLDNAIAYTPAGGSVRVDVSPSPRDVVVTVLDTGSGFTRWEREQAARPFQRFPREGSQGGMGVGLAIARDLAHRAGATLSLASVAGEGTRVELRVPATG